MFLLFSMHLSDLQLKSGSLLFCEPARHSEGQLHYPGLCSETKPWLSREVFSWVEAWKWDEFADLRTSQHSQIKHRCLEPVQKKGGEDRSNKPDKNVTVISLFYIQDRSTDPVPPLVFSVCVQSRIQTQQIRRSSLDICQWRSDGHKFITLALNLP